MGKIKKLHLLLMFVLLNLSTNHSLTGQVDGIEVTPRPVHMDLFQGQFKITKQTKLVSNFELKNQAQFFRDAIVSSTGFKLQVLENVTDSNNSIVLNLSEDLLLEYGREAYKLIVEKDKIELTAGSIEGIHYGLQTILQLLPVQVYSRVKIPEWNWEIPCVTILDYPRYAWRGFMLDASRSFQSVDYVKRTLDLMAMFKMNTFHWHLTDDHGWRIEIKKYPVLTEVGAWRPQPNYPRFGERESYGGYYTQEEIRELVNYAAERNITIVPEIDLPGHSAALNSSLSELVCENAEAPKSPHYFDDWPKRIKIYKTQEGSNVVCPGKEGTFEIIENILSEIMDLFPSEYIHIGGDEVQKHWWENCPKCKARMNKEALKDSKELQAYFINRMEKHLNANGRQLIGWDEILEGKLSKSAAILNWRFKEGAKQAVKEGRNVVLGTEEGYYIQRGQTENPWHPQKWPGINTIEQIYNYDPIPKEFDDQEKSKILGVQSLLWTPFTNKPDLWDMAIFPRNLAMAETSWTLEPNKGWQNFQERLGKNLKRLAFKGVSYWREESDSLGAFTLMHGEVKQLVFNVSPKIVNPGVYFVLIDCSNGIEEGIELEQVLLFKDGKQIASDEHLGFTTPDKDHDRIYFLDVQSKNEHSSQYELKIKLKGLGTKNSLGTVRLFKP